MSDGSEREKMLAGADYDAGDAELLALRQRARRLCQRLNALDPADTATQQALTAELLGVDSSDAFITPPFFCDYGLHLKLGARAYFNAGCTVLDVAPVTIGEHVLIGPAVQIYTALHPLDARRRRAGVESGAPVAIGDDVWIGGAAVICPGVTIGAGAVIGAGSVVTRDVPPGVFAAGNPCRVIRRLGDASA
ncbi:sugar O-acetyltransferase [Roseateles violae]|uniref:Sugar O-acetyltransferase n=1 Tax=Roseateles violae TaxID=3058042 RepID=A0ABT8DT34_9BURK|nr:sugar O-acetyltransferase [Pelomonas sp. PFR6]MDN3919469.1 sugar O-acetyltransferase [Pelomonas sp. PFR6]